MNFRRLFLSFTLLLICGATVMAQKVVSGVVTDSANAQPLAGVTITATGATAGTATAANGRFTLTVPAGTETVTVSYIGYKTQEVKIADGNLSISIAGSTGSLNEVVVVAYGTRKKGDLTGSITSVTAKDFQKGNIVSSDQLLVGKVAGLQVTSGGGSPGGGSKIRIRGGASLNASNDPLIVIDGVPIDNNSLAGSSNFLNTIDPNDIESVSVLKDASATAQYGSRASNGVLIITTKKGQPGKVRFNFNTQASLSDVPKFVPVLTADQIRDIVNKNGDTNYTKLLGTANTNWQDLVYQNAFGTDNNLSASGSIYKIPFRISGGYSNQQGVLKTDKFSRASASINLSPKLIDNHLQVNLNAKYSHTHNNFANQGAVGSAVSFDPTQSPYAQNKYGGYFEWLQKDGTVIGTNGAAAGPNPLGLLYINDDVSDVDRMIGNIQLDYKFHFLPDLHVLVNVGYDRAWAEGHHNIDSSSSIAKYKGGIFTSYQQGKTNFLADVSLLYSKELSSRTKFDVLVLHSYQDFFTNAYNVPSYNQKGEVDSTTIPTYTTDKPEYRLESYLGRVNFTLANKYLLTASLRRDASSKFSPSQRVGYFPAGALAWKLKDEFFKSSILLSELKLRLGIGVTGQQDIAGAYYPYLPVYYQSTSTAQYQFGDNYFYFLRPSAYDPNIKWETTTTSNVGLDYGFLNNRVSGSIDFYYKKTKDLLSVVPVAPGANFDITLLTNVGNMTNKGFEFTINTTPIQTKTVNWTLNFNISYNKSEITNLLKNQDANFKGIDVSNIAGGTGNTIGKFNVGYTPFTFFVYQQVYDEKTGKPVEGLYNDINRDGQVTEADRYYYKKPAPDVLSGISTQVSYKQWSLGLAGHASFGNYVYNNFYSNNGVLRTIQNPLHFIQNASTDYLNTNFSNNQYLSDYYIENGSFFRMDNINLGYNAGRIFHNAATLAITANVQNVFVITKYRGLDPEISNDQGIDNNIYPRPRIYSIGLNLNF